MDELNTVNAVQEPVVEAPQPTDYEGDETPVFSQQEEMEEQTVVGSVQSVEENARYAKIRRDAQQSAQKKIDDAYRTMFMGVTDPVTGQEIQSEQDYLNWKEHEELASEAAVRGVSIEEQRAYMEQQRKALLERDPVVQQMQRELESYRQKSYQSIYTEDLSAIKAAYPDEKATSIAQLGADFMAMRATGKVSPVAAYEAVRAERRRQNPLPPSMGDVRTLEGGEGGYFTREEVKTMTPTEVSRNYEKIRKSQERWK